MIFDRLANIGFLDLDSGGGQVTEQFAHDVLVTGFLEIGHHHVLGISISVGTAGQNQKLVAALREILAA